MGRINIFRCAVAAMLWASACGAGAYPGLSREPADSGVHCVKAGADSMTVRIAWRGIIIAGRDSCLRAMEPFGGTAAGGVGYARVVNAYKAALGDSVAVYCMPIPTAVEFYCPEQARRNTRGERPVMEALFGALSEDVIAVDVYGVLREHTDEPVYSRTDHHWAPLGAYYAAREFAVKAGVPFAGLSEYERRVVRDYVGSMYTFSRCQELKSSPEDFVYYVPKDVEYKAVFVNYRLGRNRRVIAVSRPEEHDFFVHYPDGSRDAYCTFMGGDLRTVRVSTSTGNGRRLAILKGSYGNAIPGYLFSSFEEIHVIDFRYFTKSIRKYVKDNHITDVLFVNNMLHVCLPSTHKSYSDMLSR